MSYFLEETRLQRLDDTTWTGAIGENWSIGDNPNGGYLVATALRAFSDLVPEHPDPISVTTHFLRPGIADTPCEVHAEIVRRGRSLTTGKATLSQDGKNRIEVITSLGNLDDTKVHTDTDITQTQPPAPPPESCPQRSGKEQGIHLPLLNRMDIRIHPDQAQAGAAGKPVVSGWIRFHDDSPVNSLSSIVFADAFPPSVFGLLGSIGWVPTIELTVHVRRHPSPGWIFGQFQTDDFHQDRMIESGALWDSKGNLIVQSRQVGLVLQAT